MSNDNYQSKKRVEVAEVPVVQQTPEQRIKALEMENRLLKEKAEKLEVAKQKPSMEIVPGTHTYILTKGHYRKGQLYAPGDTLTVTDEPKARSWVLVPPGDVEKAIAAKSAANPARVVNSDPEV